MIELKLVDESSFQAVLDLKISEADERARFVSPNVRSLADAWLYRENGDVFPMAIYWNELVVGFLLLEIDKVFRFILVYFQQEKANHLLIPIDCHRKHIFIFPVEPCVS